MLYIRVGLSVSCMTRNVSVEDIKAGHRIATLRSGAGNVGDVGDPTAREKTRKDRMAFAWLIASRSRQDDDRSEFG